MLLGGPLKTPAAVSCQMRSLACIHACTLEGSRVAGSIAFAHRYRRVSSNRSTSRALRPRIGEALLSSASASRHVSFSLFTCMHDCNTHRHTDTQTHRHHTHTTHHTHTRRCQARTAICSRRVARYSSPALSSSGAGTGSSAEGTMITATADACFDNFVHFVFKSLRTRTIICGSTSGYFQ